MRKHMLVIVVVPITNKGIESQDYKELLKINKKKRKEKRRQGIMQPYF